MKQKMIFQFFRCDSNDEIMIIAACNNEWQDQFLKFSPVLSSILKWEQLVWMKSLETDI